jgi:hypothetical protein
MLQDVCRLALDLVLSALAPRASHGHARPALCCMCPAPRDARPCTSRFTRSHQTRLTPCVPRASYHTHPPVPHIVRSSHSVMPASRASRYARPASTFIGRQQVDECVATVCFIRFRCMLHMFHLDVTKVNLVLHMLQVYVSSVSAVSNICCKCFILMLYMLQWLYTYVANVCFKCFTYFGRMLQVFYLDVVVCCHGYTRMLQMYISIVSPGFSMLQHVLLPMRARTRCTHPSSATYLYHAGQLQ